MILFFSILAIYLPLAGFVFYKQIEMYNEQTKIMEKQQKFGRCNKKY